MKRFALALVLAAATALPLAAQQPPQGGGPGGPAAPPDQLLREVLGFSAEQLTALQTALEKRHQEAITLQPQIAEAQRAFNEALNASTPDAARVGAALLAVQALQKQMGQVDERFRATFAGILTSEQQAKVAAIQGLRKSLQLGEVLRSLQILP